ncbi:MAG: ABC transporter permease [Bacteroidota bacterium]
MTRIKFFLRKFTSGLLVMLGVVSLVFVIFNLLPGDPARMMLGQRADVQSIEKINRELGLDQPAINRFLVYLNDLSPISVLDRSNQESRIFADSSKYGSMLQLIPIGEKAIYLKGPYLRRSYQSNRLVWDIMLDSLLGTIVLSIAALLFACCLGIPLGVWSALNKGGIIDNSVGLLAVTGMALPSFFAAVIVAWLFGFVWSDFTGLEMTGGLYTVDPFNGPVLTWKNLLLPAFTLGIRPLSVIVQLTRGSMLDVLSMDYVRTAKAKGLSGMGVVFRHALRNALNPVLTAVSGWFGSLLAGAVFIEYVFNWKGIGKVTVDSLESYDLPVVMGSVIVVSCFFIIINIAVDLLYGVLDPRVRTV